MDIILTREDMIDAKKLTPINEIKLYDFKSKETLYQLIKYINTIIFKDGDDSVILKSRN